jgi:prepilin-type N-terminal cleavage/methylation domain-containing protein
MKKAFTLIELVVAVALLAMVFVFAGTIFKVSINAYRTAVANAEIIQKLRAITDQMNADFEGIRTDAPLLFWFHEDTNDPSQRYDQIMFFADGDFQSTQLYDGPSGSEVPAPTGDPVIGDVARIHYGQAKSRDPADDTMKDPFDLKKEDRLLAKRQHILTADTDLDEWPKADMSDFDSSGAGGKLNEWYEHDRLSLSQWKTVEGDAYRDKIIPTCFVIRPLVDMGDPNTFQKLMCEGVGSFAIQWAYWDSVDGRFYWFPSNDPDGNPSTSDSHFSLISDRFGVYFNIPNGSSFSVGGWWWYPIGDNNVKYKSGVSFPSDFYPKAIKFTFRLYDSKGVIKEGRTFTHIVYIGD